MPKKTVEIMDTTLRDGEQTQGVSFSAGEKLSIAQVLLSKLKVDRIEVTSARVSKGEQIALTQIIDWAKKEGLKKRVEALGFCDVKTSADWLSETGCQVMNLLAKGSLKHLKYQLKKTPKEHLADIKKTVEYCKKKGIECNCYPEDFSSGLWEKEDYAHWLIEELIKLQIKRIMLPDTLGIMSPLTVREKIGQIIKKYPEVHFDFHAHNDYGLASANSVSAVISGVKGVHVTVNGLGERTGNASIDEVTVGINDMTDKKVKINEKQLINTAKLVEVLGGRKIPPNKPIAGEAVFTQTAGIHADGDKKGNLYVTKLSAERFGKKRIYALGKLSGKANLEMNLNQLGLELTDEEKKLVLNRIIELGDKKQVITQADLPFIVADMLKLPSQIPIKIEDCTVTSKRKGLSEAQIEISIKGKKYRAKAKGDGGYDAFMKALKEILTKQKIKVLKLENYEVRIPPGGSTDALVETTITWEGDLKTRGVDSDQVLAAIKATENMLNFVYKSN
jgi:D-citramalate synthase